MKKLLLTTLFLLTCSSVCADNIDYDAQKFNEREQQRHPKLYKDSVVMLSERTTNEIKQLQAAELEVLIDFATSYELQEVGFSYATNPNIFVIMKKGSEEVLAYTFSIDVLKNGQVSARRFCVASKRVDGSFYVSRLSDYTNLEN